MIRQAAPIYVISYARFSPRPDAKTSESNLAQFESIRAAALARGRNIVAEFEDANASGDDADRSGLWDAVAALKKGWELWVDDPQRLARDLILGEVIREKVAERGATVVCVKQGTEPTLEGELARKILACVAEYRKKADAILTSSRMKRHMATGRRVCSVKNPPYGFQNDPNGPMVTREVQQKDGSKVLRTYPTRICPHPNEQQVIAFILELAGQGKKSPTIKKILEAQGLKCRSRDTWNRDLIDRIIKRGTVA